MAKFSKKRLDQITSHETKLQVLYPATRKLGFCELYAKLHRLEAEAHKLAEDICNVQLPDGYADKKEASILRRVHAVLGDGPAVFLNGDPRGYALKIDDKIARDLHIAKDWGGYGIICPEL